MTNTEIVKKLIGPINPVGESNADAERLENLKAMCELVNELVTEIDAVAFDNRHAHQYSIKAASSYAEEFLTKTLGITNEVTA